MINITMVELTVWTVSIVIMYFMFRVLHELAGRAITKIRNWAFHRRQDRTLHDRIF